MALPARAAARRPGAAAGVGHAAPSPGDARAVIRHHASESQAILLLAADVRMAFILVNRARYWTFERVLGVGHDEANIATLIAVLAVAEAGLAQASGLRRRVRPLVASDVAWGSAAVRESIYGVAGKSSRETPLAATLVTLAVAAHLASPVVRRSIRAIRGSGARLRQALDRQDRRVRRLRPGDRQRPVEHSDLDSRPASRPDLAPARSTSEPPAVLPLDRHELRQPPGRAA